MDKHYSYLFINLLTVIFPVLLSFDSRVQFFKNWKYVFPGLLITGLSFLLWDYLFTLYDVWSFNPDYLLGIYFLNLPIEEILFFITVPFACVFIYECLNYYIKKDVFHAVAKGMTAVLLLSSAIFLFLFYDRVYTLITFSLLLILSAYMLIKKPVFLGRFYLSYLVSLLPFYLVNGLLTSIPIVMYNNAENMSLRVGTIPFEDHFYSLSMLLMNVLLFEHFRKRKGAPNG